MPMVAMPPGHVGPFAGFDVPWLLKLRAETRRDHPFVVWAPFEQPAVTLTYGAFRERVGALAAGLARRGVKPGEFVLIHLDNCLEAILAWYACAELGAIAVTTNGTVSNFVSGRRVEHQAWRAFVKRSPKMMAN